MKFGRLEPPSSAIASKLVEVGWSVEDLMLKHHCLQLFEKLGINKSVFLSALFCVRLMSYI